jgi:hypothetical protein
MAVGGKESQTNRRRSSRSVRSGKFAGKSTQSWQAGQEQPWCGGRGKRTSKQEVSTEEGKKESVGIVKKARGKKKRGEKSGCGLSAAFISQQTSA